MESKMKLNLLIAMLVLMIPMMGVSGAHAKSRTDKAAHAMWQTKDRVIEGRTSAIVYSEGYFMTDREAMVRAI
jgi:hypothetical protein